MARTALTIAQPRHRPVVVVPTAFVWLQLDGVREIGDGGWDSPCAPPRPRHVG